MLKKIVFTLGGFIIVCIVALLLLYITDINKDNFINRNQLADKELLNSFLFTKFPLHSSKIIDLYTFVSGEDLHCQFPSNDVFETFSGTVICDTPMTNPAFYGSKFLPMMLLATARDHFFFSTRSLSIRFQYQHGTLQNIEVVLYRGFI